MKGQVSTFQIGIQMSKVSEHIHEGDRIAVKTGYGRDAQWTYLVVEVADAIGVAGVTFPDPHLDPRLTADEKPVWRLFPWRGITEVSR